MFVELKLQRGSELFNISGILRVTPAGEVTRIYLFGTPQPVEVKEPYDEVASKVKAAISKMRGIK